MKYLTNSGLSYFLNKMKTYISDALSSKANSTHTHSVSDITSGLATVATSGSYADLQGVPTGDTQLNPTSTNWVTNQCVTEAIEDLADNLETRALTNDEIDEFMNS